MAHTMNEGHTNARNQRLVEKTDRPGSAGNHQRAWVLHCEECGWKYDVNGCDAWERKCPICQDGRPGLENEPAKESA